MYRYNNNNRRKVGKASRGVCLDDTAAGGCESQTTIIFYFLPETSPERSAFIRRLSQDKDQGEEQISHEPKVFVLPAYYLP